MSVLLHFPGPLEYQVSSLRTSGLEMGHPLVWSSILDQLDGQGWSKREGLVQGGGRTLFAASLPHHISGNNGDPSPLSPPIEEGPPPTSPQPVDQKPLSLPSFCPPVSPPSAHEVVSANTFQVGGDAHYRLQANYHILIFHRVSSPPPPHLDFFGQQVSDVGGWMRRERSLISHFLKKRRGGLDPWWVWA